MYRNAIQATKAGPKPCQITVTLAQEVGWALLRICNTGLGLVSEALAQVL